MNIQGLNIFTLFLHEFYIELNLLHEFFIYFMYIHGANIYDFTSILLSENVYYMQFTWVLHPLHDYYMSFMSYQHLCYGFWYSVLCFVFIHSQPDQCSWEYPLKTVHLDGCSLPFCFWTRIQVGWARWKFYGSEEHWNNDGMQWLPVWGMEWADSPRPKHILRCGQTNQRRRLTLFEIVISNPCLCVRWAARTDPPEASARGSVIVM